MSCGNCTCSHTSSTVSGVSIPITSSGSSVHAPEPKPSLQYQRLLERQITSLAAALANARETLHEVGNACDPEWALQHYGTNTTDEQLTQLIHITLAGLEASHLAALPHAHNDSEG